MDFDSLLNLRNNIDLSNVDKEMVWNLVSATCTVIVAVAAFFRIIRKTFSRLFGTNEEKFSDLGKLFMYEFRRPLSDSQDVYNTSLVSFNRGSRKWHASFKGRNVTDKLSRAEYKAIRALVYNRQKERDLQEKVKQDQWLREQLASVT